MTVRDTSMEAFEELREEGKINEREKDVLEWVDEYNSNHEKNGTAREIHEWLAVDKGNEEAQLNGPNYIKPRITDLKGKGYIEEDDQRECSVTGRKAYEVKTVAKQETVVEDEDDYYVDEDGNKFVFDPNEEPDVDETGSEDGKSEAREELEELVGLDEEDVDDSGSKSQDKAEQVESDEDDGATQKLLMQDGEVV